MCICACSVDFSLVRNREQLMDYRGPGILAVYDFAHFVHDHQLRSMEDGVFYAVLFSTTQATELHNLAQCSGSESGYTGSTCFWASRIRIH